MRLSKYLASLGLGSRREMDRAISEARVAANGIIVQTGALYTPHMQALTIDGIPVHKELSPPRLFRFYKPNGLVTTHHDPESRPTVFSFLKDQYPDLPRVISVGRLDLNTEGLLLLTTQGEVARHLELPSTGWERVYRVRTFGSVNFHTLQKNLAEGTEIEGILYRPIKISQEHTSGQHTWLTMTLVEGKNREIRRVLNAFGLHVSRLIRVQYGPFMLEDLKPGQIKEVLPFPSF